MPHHPVLHLLLLGSPRAVESTLLIDTPWLQDVLAHIDELISDVDEYDLNHKIGEHEITKLWLRIVISSYTSFNSE